LKARRKGAPVTIFRLGEVMPSADNGCPNRQALTHFLLSAFYRLGVCPMAAMRSDYTPVDYVAARVAAAVSDRALWGRTLHVFHSESVCFSDVLARIGTHVTRVSCTDFLVRLDQAVHETRQRDLVTLRALLPQGARDEVMLQQAFSRLLTDNPRLFLKENCRKLERRWGMADEWLNGAISAYRDYLEDHAGQSPRLGADVSREVIRHSFISM
ncbi:MAG TPA: SDR family oxidoreductase, partial [Noviherbaspirillum sp.]|nr:SDR family oxidoreductase [Noviherbaspirillum sp.]